jgi:peptide/nickel transport system substrate-binding protein
MKKSLICPLAAALALFAGAAAAQTTLRIGLAEDPDVLDPTLARTFVGRVVFNSLCDKLFDLDQKLNVVPRSPRATNGRRTTRRSPSSCAG